MKKWHFPQYDFTFYYLNDTKEIRDSRIRLLFAKDVVSGCAGACRFDRKTRSTYILIVPDKDTDFPMLVDTVSHEVFHAVNDLFNCIGDDTKLRHSSEMAAYYQGYLTGEIIRALGYE